MPRIPIILLICCAYVGCAVPRSIDRRSEPQSPSGGTIRVLVGSALSAEQVADSGSGYVDEVESVDDGGNPVLMLQLGEADLAVLIGKQVRALAAEPGDDFRLERLQLWDRSYFLWLDPTKRWVNDPTFRRWLAASIDREQMLWRLFDGEGEPALSLTPGRANGPVWQQPLARPFGDSSEPRIDLHYDGGDPWAASIAARLKAVLEVEGVRLSLTPADRRDLAGQLTAGAVSMAVLLYRQRPPDAVTGLTEIFEPLGEEAAAELDLLERAARHSDEGVRSEMAWWAESSMLRDARVVPLVRLHCWMAVRRGLTGVESGHDGELILERARWSR